MVSRKPDNLRRHLWNRLVKHIWLFGPYIRHQNAQRLLRSIIFLKIFLPETYPLQIFVSNIQRISIITVGPTQRCYDYCRRSIVICWISSIDTRLGALCRSFKLCMLAVRNAYCYVVSVIILGNGNRLDAYAISTRNKRDETGSNKRKEQQYKNAS